MIKFERIGKVVEAQELITKAMNNIMAAITGIPSSHRIHDEVIDPLLWILDPTPNREADTMNLQNVLEAILSSKLFLLVDSDSAEKIHSAHWDGNKAEQYREINEACSVVEVDVE